MAHLYLLEFFVDTVTIMPALDDYSGSSKSLIIKINFDSKEFLIKENQIIGNDFIPKDEFNDRNWTRSIRVGKSFLFAASPEAFLKTLKECPIGVIVWTDDDKEKELFVGVGEAVFHSNFYFMVKHEAQPCSPVSPLSMKLTVILNAECCCKVCGEVNMILRLTCVGISTTTTFQQLMTDPKTFVFETENVLSAYEVKRIDNLPQYDIVGSLYGDEKGIHPPRVTTVEVCTDMDDCAKDETICIQNEIKEYIAQNTKSKVKDGKIKMGDIVGLCGNVNCPMAHRIRNYLRQSNAYKSVYEPDKVKPQSKTKIVCGECICRSSQWKGVEKCLEFNKPMPDPDKVTGICKNCGGYVGYNEKNCKERHIQGGGSPIPEQKPNNPTVMRCTVDTKLAFREPFCQCMNYELNNKTKSVSEIKVSNNNIDIERCCSTSVLLHRTAPEMNSCIEGCKLLNELAAIVSTICIADLLK